MAGKTEMTGFWKWLQLCWVVDNSSGVQKIGTFRRIFPQILGATAKNMVVLNLGEFTAFSSIVISALVGMSTELNPNETIHITAAQSSSLSMCSFIVHPIGSLLSGIVCDKFGRRTTLLILTIPLAFTWLLLGFAQSFSIVCFCFAAIGFCMGIKESPAALYSCEICEPNIRGTIASLGLVSHQFGFLIVFTLGTMLTWRQIAFTCAIFPLACFFAVLFVPETPSWLLTQNRFTEAENSLRWLRGWVSAQTVHKELIELQNYANESTACPACTKQSIKCFHEKPTFSEKIAEFKRKRTIKPFLLVTLLYFFFEASPMIAIQPYVILVLKAYGTPINENSVTVLLAAISILSCICLSLTVHALGKRRIYLMSIVTVTLCSFGLSIYGFIFFPLGWTSFGQYTPEQYAHLKTTVGNYSYVAFGLILIMEFSTRIGVFGLSHTYMGEVFPLKSRSFLVAISTGIHFLMSSIMTKLYFHIETWLSLPGAIAFYGFLSLIGFIVFYFILPETERRSLEDIEHHYSDNTKGMADIYIRKKC